MPISLKKTKRVARPDYGYVWLELPRSVIDRIDRDRQKRDVPVSRVKWLHEAACEKLKSK